MNEATKIPFSIAEMELIENGEVFLTKKKASQHISHFLQMLQEEIEQFIRASKSSNKLLDDLTYRKISKGESYLDFPYQVSDYPALFLKKNIITVRCLVWWGNEVSIHLLVAGSFLQKFLPVMKRRVKELDPQFFGCVNSNPWEHHFHKNNYVPIRNFELVEQASFCKIGKKYPLSVLCEDRYEIVSDIKLLLQLLEED